MIQPPVGSTIVVRQLHGSSIRCDRGSGNSPDPASSYLCADGAQGRSSGLAKRRRVNIEGSTQQLLHTKNLRMTGDFQRWAPRDSNPEPAD